VFETRSRRERISCTVMTAPTLASPTHVPGCRGDRGRVARPKPALDPGLAAPWTRRTRCPGFSDRGGLASRSLVPCRRECGDRTCGAARLRVVEYPNLAVVPARRAVEPDTTTGR